MRNSDGTGRRHAIPPANRHKINAENTEAAQTTRFRTRGTASASSRVATSEAVGRSVADLLSIERNRRSSCLGIALFLSGKGGGANPRIIRVVASADAPRNGLVPDTNS